MECLTKFCVCLFFVTVTVHGVSAALLQACDDNTPCTGTGGDPKAVCAKDNEPGGDGDGNCICTGAFKKNANSDGCVAKGLLEVCADDPACRVDGGDQNAVCSKDINTGGDNDGNCICTGAFKNNLKNDGCVAKVITNNDCTSDAAGNTKCQGVDTNAVCSASPTKCACKADYFLSTDKTTCVQKITTVGCTPGTAGTAACKKVDANADCQAGGDKCSCKAGYKGTDSCTKIATETDCNPNSGGDSKCHDVDPNAVCPASTTKCACKPDYFIGSAKTCVQKITTVACTPDDNTEGTTKCQKVDENSECPAEGDKCACKDGYSGTDSCTKDAGSSATSAWMTTSLIATSLLIYLPRLIKW